MVCKFPQTEVSANHRRTTILFYCFTVLLALTAYFYGLDSVHIPNIGDEWRYIQISSATASSHKFLPLLSDKGLDNTKPPMLFWQGMLSTFMGHHHTLLNFRIPIVIISFLIAFMVGLVARKLSGNIEVGFRAGIIYLGFWSTVQHGRPFLTNAPETFFLFLPLTVLLITDKFGWKESVIIMISLGIAALYKSFFLAIVGTFAVFCILLYRNGFSIKKLLTKHMFHLSFITTGSLFVFSLWFVIDPNPGVVFKQFIISENCGKFHIATFISGLFCGSYPLTRIWLGPFANAGVYALVTAGYFFLVLKKHKQFASGEKQILLYILALLVIYSFPTQRQENYLLPTSAALAVLLSLRWKEISPILFQITCFIAAIAFAGTLWAGRNINTQFSSHVISNWPYLFACFFCILALIGAFRKHFSQTILPVLIFGILFTGSLFISPFSKIFKNETISRFQNSEVLFPQGWGESYERYKFMLPGAVIHQYKSTSDTMFIRAKYVAVLLDAGQNIPEGYLAVDSLYDFKNRQSASQIKQILFDGRFDLLMHYLVILEKKPGMSPNS